MQFLESGAGDRLLYDVEHEPDASEDRAAQEPERAERLRSAVERWFAELPEAPRAAASVTTETMFSHTRSAE